MQAALGCYQLDEVDAPSPPEQSSTNPWFRRRTSPLPARRGLGYQPVRSIQSADHRRIRELAGRKADVDQIATNVPNSSDSSSASHSSLMR